MDPISEMLIKIKNAGAAHKKTVSFPYSEINYQLAKILAKEGFIETVKKRTASLDSPQKRIVIRLKYENGESKVHDVKKISKPGRRLYFKSKELYFPKNSYGILIVSTPKGLLTSKEAKKLNVGGEALCEIW
ncbi:MAG TPA: 30S ribosomal protein S8 [Candidatus Pacearchaeota archaeon]|nr:30S ribosomal protein S8 [Candidatus Pacearchaeota archaeon]HOK94053.1 30S ribosomal protein S8 [Candidatus Pacearchaeota archaeon]HPO75124.1 30S ribosomal protein S8 [Candidatus Pacearchaeota archaeon]